MKIISISIISLRILYEFNSFNLCKTPINEDTGTLKYYLAKITSIVGNKPWNPCAYTLNVEAIENSMANRM